MKAEIDQISFNTETLSFFLYVSTNGVQHNFEISQAKASAILQDSKHSIEFHSKFVYYIFKNI